MRHFLVRMRMCMIVLKERVSTIFIILMEETTFWARFLSATATAVAKTTTVVTETSGAHGSDTEADHGKEAKEHESHHSVVFIGVMMAMVIMFFFFEGLNHKMHWKYGHETGATILLGSIFSIIYYFAKGMNKNDYEEFRFRPNIFFNMILPPIIMSSGYNMHQKKFFANIGNIAITGLAVTFVNFALYSLGLYYVLHYFDLTMTRYRNNHHPEQEVPNTLPVNLTMMEILMFTSLLCSSDVVAAVSIIDFKA